MILALDSYYKDDICNTSYVIFDEQNGEALVHTDTIYTKVTSEYIPGEFYKRELPGIIQIIEKLINEKPDLWDKISVIITDSFLKLKTDVMEWDGLGIYLSKYLKSKGCEKVIWGVAKSKFGDCDKISELVCRGESEKPLFVQSTVDNKIAANAVKHFNGKYRIPDMLKKVDQLSRVF